MFETATRYSAPLAGGSRYHRYKRYFFEIAKPLRATPPLRYRYHCPPPHPIKDSEERRQQVGETADPLPS